MTPHSVLHTSFVIDRQFKAPPKRVFSAWTDPEIKRLWSDCHADLPGSEYSLEFRVGGTEVHRVVYPNGAVQRIEKHFFDIVPDARIIFGYDIQLDARRLSVSLVTVQFEPSRVGTRMLMAEYISYLDGHEDLEARIRGTNEGLDRLDQALQTALPAR
jgi:uncharacterized protein YndB with AHSA1/START domain